MKKIRINVKRQMFADEAQMKSKLQNIKSYKNWFPSRFNPKIVMVNENDNFIFSALPGVKVAWQMSEPREDKILLEYTQGPVSGVTYWQVTSQNGKIVLENVMEVLGKNWFVHMLMSNFIFRWKHIFDMKSVLRSLDRHLENSNK